MKTLSDLRSLANEKKLQLLTVELAKTLKGKSISTIYFGHNNQDGINNFIVGDVISELEYYRNLNEDCYRTKPNGFSNRAEYWESYMSDNELARKRNTLILLTSDGRNTFIRSYPENEGDFTCSDSDRFVLFCEDEN